MQLISLLFVLASLSTTAFARPTQLGGDCGMDDSVGFNVTSEMLIQPAMESLRADQALSDADIRVILYKIPVVFHVIKKKKGTSEADGHVNQSRIDQSIDLLNKAYNPLGFEFYLSSAKRWIQPSWFSKTADRTKGGPAGTMRKQLRKGGAGVLNVYTVGFETNATLNGYAEFPWKYAGSPVIDGVVLRCSRIPGGNKKSLGSTLVHEIGHWLGLFHTHQGGCKGVNKLEPGRTVSGDGITDTAPELPGRLNECPTGRNSCPGDNKVDPIHNFMSYHSDACRTEFTSDQGLRMVAEFKQYRSRRRI